MFPVKPYLRTGVTAAAGLVLLLGLIGCGKKANPVIPVKVLPKPASLGYQVKGKSLVVSWDIPTQNTDGSPLKDLKGFRVQKADWPTRNFCATCPENFQESLWIDLKGPEAPDVMVGPEQVQLIFNRLEPGHTYLYQVTPVTRKEIAGAPSKTLRVDWDLPLKSPAELQAKPKGQGLELSWSPVQSLIDGSSAEGLVGYALYRRLGKGSWTPLNKEPIRETSYLDDELQEGVTYTYQVKALRKSYGQVLESEGSEEKKVAYTRVAPPPPVQELVAVGGPNGIQIRWEGLVTMTPRGYYVYRRTGQEKAPQRLNKEPVIETIFEDRPVVRGTTYYYSISAVGGPPALLEGPRSKEAEVVYNP
jgi:hypothetical protein